MRAAIGFAVHTGWAAAVAVGGPPAAVLARRRIELADDEARFVYHAASERRRDAARMIREAERTAKKRAVAAVRALVAELDDSRIVACVLPPARRALPPLDAILDSHPLIHTAEGELYRRALVAASGALGLRLVELAAGAVPDVGKMSPPWGKDQKQAAALAWAALAGSA
jgi:hypothetical protein